jgi:hypothetical protein
MGRLERAWTYFADEVTAKGNVDVERCREQGFRGLKPLLRLWKLYSGSPRRKSHWNRIFSMM